MEAFENEFESSINVQEDDNIKTLTQNTNERL